MDLAADVTKQTTTYETGEDRSSQNSSNRQHRQTAKREERKFTNMAYKIRHPDRTLNEFAGIAQTIKQPHNQWDDYLKEEHEREGMNMKSDLNTTSMATQIGLTEVAERNFKKSHPQLSSMYGVGF